MRLDSHGGGEEGTLVTEIRRDMVMCTTSKYSGSTLGNKIRIHNLMRNAQIVSEGYAKSLGLFVSRRLRIMFCLSAYKLRTAGAMLCRSLISEVNVWPESKALCNGQKR